MISETVKKIETAAESVSAISSDSVILGTNVNTINQAIAEVETSNVHLVENMNSVNEVMSSIIEKIKRPLTVPKKCAAKTKKPPLMLSVSNTW